MAQAREHFEWIEGNENEFAGGSSKGSRRSQGKTVQVK